MKVHIERLNKSNIFRRVLPSTTNSQLYFGLFFGRPGSWGNSIIINYIQYTKVPFIAGCS